MLTWCESGAGEVLLFVHGFPLDSRMWDAQLASMPAGWRGVAPDLRGFGRSEAADGPYTMDVFADDLAELLDHLGEARAVVCGLSMGGYVTFAFWRRHVDRVRALVLADTRAGADSDEARKGRHDLAARVRSEGSAAAANAMLPRLLAERTRRERPGDVARLTAIMEAQPAETLARALEGMAVRPDSVRLLASIDVPVLVVVGSDDAITSVAESESMVRDLQDARLTVIDGAGHLTPVEDPTAFGKALEVFLRGLGPGGSR